MLWPTAQGLEVWSWAVRGACLGFNPTHFPPPSFGSQSSWLFSDGQMQHTHLFFHHPMAFFSLCVVLPLLQRTTVKKANLTPVWPDLNDLPWPENTKFRTLQSLKLFFFFLSLKLFKSWRDTTSGKFHNWLHRRAHSQNAGTLRILCKITFRLCASGIIWDINE